MKTILSISSKTLELNSVESLRNGKIIQIHSFWQNQIDAQLRSVIQLAEQITRSL